MSKNTGHRPVLVLTLTALIAGCEAGQHERPEAVRTATEALTIVKRTLAIELPSGAGLFSIALGATSGLRIADGVEVRSGTGSLSGPSGFAGVSNIGTSQNEIGADAKVGDVWSQGALFLRERAKVNGFVHAAGQVTQQNGVFKEGTETLATLLPKNDVSWSIDFVVGTETVNLEPDQERTLAPGGYADVSVKSRSTLKLSAGRYYLKSLAVEPQATLSLDTRNGPIFVYVNNGLVHKGKNSYLGDDRSALFGHFGTSTVALESPFDGTVVAPSSPIYLAPVGTSPGHRGSFYAKSINVEAWTKVTYAPFKHVTKLFPEVPKHGGPTTAGTPPPLTVAGLGAFIDWALRATPSDMAPGRNAIAQAQGNTAVANTLVSTFRANENGAVVKALVILGILGELRSPAGEALFVELLHRSVPPVGPPSEGHVDDSARSRALAYQSKAAHGLGVMPTQSAASQLRGVMKTHPQRGIRAEAVRAYTFGQPAIVKAEIRAYLNPADKIFVDRFENRNLTSGAMTFDAQLADYISKHPEVMP